MSEKGALSPPKVVDTSSGASFQVGVFVFFLLAGMVVSQVASGDDSRRKCRIQQEERCLSSDYIYSLHLFGPLPIFQHHDISRANISQKISRHLYAVATSQSVVVIALASGPKTGNSQSEEFPSRFRNVGIFRYPTTRFR